MFVIDIAVWWLVKKIIQLRQFILPYVSIFLPFFLSEASKGHPGGVYGIWFPLFLINH